MVWGVPGERGQITEDTPWEELDTTLTRPWLVPTEVSGSTDKPVWKFSGFHLIMSPTSCPFSTVL